MPRPRTTDAPPAHQPAAYPVADVADLVVVHRPSPAARREIVRAALRPDGSLPGSEACRLAAVCGVSEAVIRADQRELRVALALPPTRHGPAAARARALARFLGVEGGEGRGEGGSGSRVRREATPPFPSVEKESNDGSALARASAEDSTVPGAPFTPEELSARVQGLIRASITVMEHTLAEGRGDRTAVELAKWVVTEGRRAFEDDTVDQKQMRQLAAALDALGDGE